MPRPYIETPTLPVTAAALNAHERVALDSNGEVSAADASEEWIGTAEHDVPSAASGDAVRDRVVAVHLVNATGTMVFIASAAISIGDVLEPAAAGKVATRTTGRQIGVALTAASADGDLITALPIANTIA